MLSAETWILIFSKNDQKCTQYKNIVEWCNCKFIIEHPTRISNKTSSCIHHVITKISNNAEVSGSISTFDITHHKGINIHVPKANRSHKQISTIRKHSNKKIQQFCKEVSNIDWSWCHLNDKSTVNENVENFTACIDSEYNKSFPICEKKKLKTRNNIEHTNRLKPLNKKLKKL